MVKFNKIAFIDFETTGTDTKNDRIVELAIFKTDLDFNYLNDLVEMKLNPMIPIPKEASDVHGILDEHIAACQKFSDIASGLNEYLQGCHIAGYNIKFDIQILYEELNRVGIEFSMDGRMIIDAYVNLIKMEPRDQSSIYKYYTGKTLEGAHGAMADIKASLEIIQAQKLKYPSLVTIEDMNKLNEPEKRCDLAGKIVLNSEGIPVFNFGKNYNKPISEDVSYLNWMLKADMPTETKIWINKYLEKSKGEDLDGL